jgi:hypothetical protein
MLSTVLITAGGICAALLLIELGCVIERRRWTR